MKINSDRAKVISPQGFTSLQQLLTIIHHFGYFWDKKFHLLVNLLPNLYDYTGRCLFACVWCDMHGTHPATSLASTPLLSAHCSTTMPSIPPAAETT